MTAAMTVRRAWLDDLDLVVALHAQFCVVDGHEFDPARARDAIAPLLADDERGVIWLIDEPAGYAVVTWGWSIEGGGLEGVLDEIFVSEPGGGHGGALLDHLLTDAARRGLRRVFLETERPNTRARRLYARHGFVEDDSIWMTHTL